MTSDRTASTGAWLLEHGHRAVLAVTGGRFPKKLLGMKTLELHTVGRKSGRPYANLLTSPVYDDERIVVVASKGGHSVDPDWYRNAVANPMVEVTVDGTTRSMLARTASAPERAELWPLVVKANPGYEGYQRNTEREIPLLILESR